MAGVLTLFDVEFQISKVNPNAPGAASLYRREKRRATVSAASGHPKDLLAVLSSDISIAAGEVIEILSSQPHSAAGTEGGGILS